jgi:adenosylcobinamide-GDP ribazoletransferase
VSGLAEACSFLTIVGRGRRPTRASLAWFGPVGLLVGAACGLVRWGADAWWAAAVAAVLTVGADLVLTGALHLDGLADSADGLLPHLGRERRLAVRATPDLGTFAIATVAVVLLLRWSTLATADLEGWHWLATLGGLWCGARAAMAVIVTTVPYARPEGGLATAFAGGRWWAATPGAVLALAAVAAGDGGRGALALVAGALAALAVVALARRRLGGFTGDVAGAAGIVLETVSLLVVAARW